MQNDCSMKDNTDPILVSLSDYQLDGEGYTAESYVLKSDPSVMIKLFFPGKINQAFDELRMARKVYQSGIPTPEPGDLVTTEDGRMGIRFRRIIGKKSYSRATGDNPDDVQRYATEFAEMCKILHAVHLDTSQFENVKDRYLRLLEENPFFTTVEKDKIARFIFDAPESDTAIHGDLQYSNAIFTEDARYFIDLGDFCYGYNLFDVAMVYLCGNLSSEEFIREAYHMSKAVSQQFWAYFAAAYFGSDRPLRSIEEEIRPYAGIKTLIIERETRCPMPEFRAALSSVL